MTSETPSALRRYFQAHNRRCLLLAAGSALAAAVLWALIWFVMQWGVLMVQGIVHPDAGGRPSVQIPFLVLAGLIFAGHWLRQAFSDQSQRAQDQFRWGGSFLDLLLAPASLAMTAPENLTARVHPSEVEMAAAWQVLQRIEAEGKLSLAELPQEIADPKVAEYVPWLLGITNLTDLDEYDGAWHLRLKNETSRSLVRHYSTIQHFHRRRE